VKAINVMLALTLLAAPFSAPSATSTLNAEAGVCFRIAPARRCAHGREATRASFRCAFARDSAAAFVAGNALFAHIDNLATLPVGRGLAQPAV
jgi:hypothetical protein